MDPVFIGGLPARITPHDFRRYHLASFPRLAGEEHDGLIGQAIETVYTVFAGVGDIWRRQTRRVWFDKTRACYRLLVAWFIADLYPGYVAGTPVMGGIPLRRKKVDGVDLTFQESARTGGKDYANLLAGLDSNPFGKMAKLMITASAARFRTRNHPRV